MMITVAHNFEDCEQTLKNGVFVLHRFGSAKFSAMFKVLNDTIRLHHRFDIELATEEGVF